jgi:hypothetical protein
MPEYELTSEMESDSESSLIAVGWIIFEYFTSPINYRLRVAAWISYLNSVTEGHLGKRLILATFGIIGYLDVKSARSFM